MATAEEIERVLALLRASAPGERYREVNSTAMGIESFKAQEKSTISTASVLVILRVSRYVKAVPPRV